MKYKIFQSRSQGLGRVLAGHLQDLDESHTEDKPKKFNLEISNIQNRIKIHLFCTQLTFNYWFLTHGATLVLSTGKSLSLIQLKIQLVPRLWSWTKSYTAKFFQYVMKLARHTQLWSVGLVGGNHPFSWLSCPTSYRDHIGLKRVCLKRAWDRLWKVSVSFSKHIKTQTTPHPHTCRHILYTKQSEGW